MQPITGRISARDLQPAQLIFSSTFDPRTAYRASRRFYSQVVGPLHRQLPVIDAVLDGRADVGPVDAYGLDLLRHHGAERAKRVRVVATTVEAPSAPLVSSPGVDVPTRKISGYILVGKRSWGITLTKDESKLFVANGFGDDVTIIDVKARKATVSIPVGRIPWGIVIDE